LEEGEVDTVDAHPEHLQDQEDGPWIFFGTDNFWCSTCGVVFLAVGSSGSRDMGSEMNKIKCLKCETVIESKYRHDFNTCKCGDVSVDGGHAYSRRVFEKDAEWEELDE
jgi:hypothetical protein